MPASPAEASAIVKAFSPGTPGLTPITTAEQLAALARSDEPADVKRDILAAMVVGVQQNIEADLKHRLQAAEKEGLKLRRQLADAKDEAGMLHGDVRVRDERIRHLKAHRNRETFLMFLSSILFGAGGAFIGRSLAATIIGFAAGFALFVYVWRDTPSDAGETR